MNERAIKIKVGLMILMGLVVLILGYYWLRNYQLRKEYHTYRVKFRKIGWVNKGDLVTVMGVPKGRVEDIQLYGDSVIIIAKLENVRLREGATATLVSLGIIGQMRLSFTLGNGPPLPDNFTIEGRTQKDMGELVSELGTFLASSDSLIGYGISLINQTSGILKIASQKIISSSEKFDSLVVTLNNLSSYLKSTIHEFYPQVKKSVQDADTAAIRLNKLIADIDSLTSVILSEKGTAGKIVNDDSLYIELKNTLKSLRELMEDIKKHPKKYVHVKIF